MNFAFFDRCSGGINATATPHLTALALHAITILVLLPNVDGDLDVGL